MRPRPSCLMVLNRGNPLTKNSDPMTDGAGIASIMVLMQVILRSWRLPQQSRYGKLHIISDSHSGHGLTQIENSI